MSHRGAAPAAGASVTSLRDCAFYVSGFNPVVDNVVMPLGVGAMKAAPGALGRPYARLLAWALRRFGRPPYGVVWQVEAEGEGRRREAAVSSACASRTPTATGSPRPPPPPACCSGLDGSLRAGVHLQALAVDPARLLRDLQRMGAQLAGRGVDVAEIVACRAVARSSPALARGARWARGCGVNPHRWAS